MTHELRDLALQVATEAGRRAVAARQIGVAVEGLKSTPTDVVTRADREVEAYIRGVLTTARPRDGFLGEESADSIASESGLTWVVDPIDGTVNYLYDLPAWAISVAVVEGDPDPLTWRTVAGCVVNPTTQDVYAAAAGLGATHNGARLELAPKSDLGTSLIATGFGYDASIREQQATVLTRLIGRVRDIRRFGAASLDLCGVASGRLDGYYENGLNPWDHAGGALIAREAGAAVGGWDDEPESARLLVAANPGIVDALRQALLDAGLQPRA